jgi:hypothetical protein
MPNWRTMIEKDYLGAWDLVGKDEKPRDFVVEIKKVASVSLKTRQTPKGKRKVVITFANARKAFVSNTTNCETIQAMYGPDTDGWVGKLITLYQTDVRNPDGKGTVKGIRVRPKRPSGQAEDIPDRDVDPEIRAAQNEAFDRDSASAPIDEREPGEEG